MKVVTRYQLLDIKGNFIKEFKVFSDRKPYEQLVINRIVEMGLNPLLYYYKAV